MSLRLRLVGQRAIHSNRIEGRVHFLGQHVHDIDASMSAVGFVVAAAVTGRVVAGPGGIGTGRCAAATVRRARVGQLRRISDTRERVAEGRSLGSGHSDGKDLVVGSIAGGVTRNVGGHVAVIGLGDGDQGSVDDNEEYGTLRHNGWSRARHRAVNKIV